MRVYAAGCEGQGAQNVKGRIRHLEQLVLNLMDSRDAQTNGTTSPPWSDTRTSKADTRTATALPSAQTRDGKEFQMPPAIQLTPPYADSPVNHAATMAEPAADAGLGAFGQMKITKNQTSYVGDSHWVAILHSIDELKRDLDTEDEQSPTSSAEEEPLQEERSGTSSFLLGSPRRVTKAELLQSLPDKAVMDGLLSQWFNAPDPFKPIVHAPTFQEEYRQFCRNPGQTPVMWIGVLFAIMSLATSFTLRSDLDKATLDEQAALVDKYHEMAAAAAVLGGFTRPKAHTLECLILYAGGLRSMSAYMDIWLVLGLVVRLALRMGYHRDPSHYPNISPFEGEIRRRTWFVIYMADVLISFQLGLPSMIRTISSDTQVPRNLMDSDFNVNTVELPPSRPVEQLTPGSYGIAKVRICRVFATAAENSHDTVPPSYPEVIKLDAQLEKARALIPPPLQFRPLEECITDSPNCLCVA
ncbi:hypothetical protein H2203_005970 [Taxawa tesnikishii (nom. ined.)]|nr:hypothetical protein H2203_005970 [Dothideales sp. JES 119]